MEYAELRVTTRPEGATQEPRATREANLIQSTQALSLFDHTQHTSCEETSAGRP